MSCLRGIGLALLVSCIFLDFSPTLEDQQRGINLCLPSCNFLCLRFLATGALHLLLTLSLSPPLSLSVSKALQAGALRKLQEVCIFI